MQSRSIHARINARAAYADQGGIFPFTVINRHTKCGMNNEVYAALAGDSKHAIEAGHGYLAIWRVNNKWREGIWSNYSAPHYIITSAAIFHTN